MIDAEDMLYLFFEITYDNRLKGLDYEEEFQVSLEFDEELKNNQNNIINDDEEHDPIQVLQKRIYEKLLSGIRTIRNT